MHELEPLDESELPEESVVESKNNNDLPESFKFKPITFGDEDQMRRDVLSLSYEQRIAFDFIIQFCKRKKIQRNNPSFIVAPERLIVTGEII